MGDGDVDQFSHALGRFEVGIETLTEAVKDIREALTGVATANHSHGERLDKLEPRVDMLHEHHTGRTAIARFLKLLPWAGFWGLAGTVASNWKSLIAMMH